MDLTYGLLAVISSFVAGVGSTLFVIWHLFNVYVEKQPLSGAPHTPVVDSFQPPKGILEGANYGKESSGALNALFQFLFQECRNTKRVRQWFHQRLTLELEELLTRTTTGKLFERIQLRDLNLGSHFPAIQSVEVKTLSMDPDTRLIEEVELCFDLDYMGGFQMSIDATMRLSKTAHVSVKVDSLSGKACLKFTRTPYTHWYFSFYNDPALQLSVESQFQGRNLPQVNTIIANQIRKALKRKHTLPFYKIRYKPFFKRTELEVLEGSDSMAPPPGTLELNVIEATRLKEASSEVFCKIALDSMAWIEMVQSGSGQYLTVDLCITKVNNTVGAVFKQKFISDKYQVCVTVESCTPNQLNELKPGDVILYADGKKVTSLSSLNKAIKGSQSKVTFRVERRIKSSYLNEDKFYQEPSEPLGLRHRNGSGPLEKTDSDSSNPPSSSGSPAKKLSRESPDHSSQLTGSFDNEVDFNLPQVYSTQDVPFSKVVPFNKLFTFHVLPEHRYVNLSVWSRGTDENTLLGHISLPVATTFCTATHGHHVSTFSLLPPNPNMASGAQEQLSSHPGFEPCLCFGDVLLTYTFSPSGEGVSPQPPPPTPALQPPPVPTPSLPETPDGGGGPPHDFIRTHFEKVQQCGFCFKKIWLKDALQCQGCHMSCHKKCGPRAQQSSCVITRKPSLQQPEIIMTSPDETLPSSQGGRTLSTLIASVTPKGLKRAGSATNLAPPGFDSSPGGSSISLPPSPNHSPSPSRKTSLVESGLFSISDSSGDEINQALEQLLLRPHDEGVMDAAKASGKLLFADLPPDVRKTRIDDMMNKLKDAIDAESHNHQALVKEEQAGERDPATRAKLAFLAGKSEERLQALTVLMLHCCAGLQDSQEALTN